MKYAVAAFAAAMLSAGAVSAQTTSPSATKPSSTQLSASECTSLWQKANAANAKGVTEMQAKPYVTDFKAANPDGDTTIDQNEWMAACNKGLVKASAASGASSGTSGASSEKTTEHPPTNRMDDAVPDMKAPNKK